VSVVSQLVYHFLCLASPKKMRLYPTRPLCLLPSRSLLMLSCHQISRDTPPPFPFFDGKHCTCMVL